MDPSELLREFLEGKVSRRDFCKIGAIAAFFHVVGFPVLNEGRATVTRLIEKARSALGDADYQNDLIFSVFGDFRKNAKFTPGTAHYLFPNKMHPDDVIAGAVLEKVGSLGITNLKIVDNFFDLRDLEGTLVALGSPMSNFLSRAILAYQFVSSNPDDGIKRDKDKSFFELPFEYVMDATQLRTAGAMANRMVDGKVHSVPNWSIWSAAEKNMLVPSVDDSGQLQSDYLLVTVLPNIFSRRSYEAGDRIVIFGGTHGVATKAVELLFRDSELLGHLRDKVESSPYWQAVFKVNHVSHDPKGGRAVPFSLAEDFQCAPAHYKRTLLERRLRV
jgi:hypothetical protein